MKGQGHSLECVACPCGLWKFLPGLGFHELSGSISFLIVYALKCLVVL